MQPHSDTRDIVAVGASAGGVPALTALFSRLPASLPAAVLVVLHIPAHSPSFLHSIISRATRLRVVAAENGMRLEKGTVYVAIPDRHLTVDADRVKLTRGPKECRARPSIDALFRSAAVHCGPRAIGVLLTGALDDGTAGLWAIKDQGGMALVQDPSEAEHASMPETAIEHVETDFVGNLASLAQQIAERCGEPVATGRRGVAPERMAVENRIAGGASGMESGIMELGNVSRYTCPECHGVLVEIHEGSIVRFRCHTGHAFSMKTLMAELNVEIDRTLWDTVRSIEEKIMLLRQAAELARNSGNLANVDRYLRVTEAANKSLKPLRELVEDPALFHD
ncbi:chemotaxis protein CheB [Paraburkholderia diazotrophica]|uniref:protein-glutamate methylesterase n=1 Tax=Paraburkholderia diazotrophica TaxID=667676 RepID=A0A1H7EG25_9BURK|nr:chemotaxis protein CheB [Paraburkholderia diazotrophica]SEK10992.1 two-component system, chemotaxis family, response regulator CheB [Paraburkholderia diazotrophica]